MKKTMAIGLGLLVGGIVSLAAADESRVMIVNAAGVDDTTLEAVRSHAERELFVPVAAEKVAVTKGEDLKVIGKKLADKKTEQDACLVVLANVMSETNVHSKIMTNEQVVVINVAALLSDDPVKFTRRLQRWVLRGAALLFGVGPDIDPHCVMHDYITLDELDKMGLNFSPPWMDMFRDAAEKRGLTVRPFGVLPPGPVR